MIKYVRTEEVSLHEVRIIAHTDSGYLLAVTMDREAIGDFLRTIGRDPCAHLGEAHRVVR